MKKLEPVTKETMQIHVGSIVYAEEKNELILTSSLGHGGMGQVFSAVDNTDESTWAVKVLPSSSESGTDFQALANEFKLAKDINHKNVIRYRYYHDGTSYPELPPYLIIEFAPEGDLDRLIHRGNSSGNFLSNDELENIFNQLIDGIEAINEKLFHRDLKPANILLSGDLVKISDFGLAKFADEATRTLTFKYWGSRPYMAPELFMGESFILQSEIYALGVVFFELATFTIPIEPETDSPDAWKKAHMSGTPKDMKSLNQSISSELQQVIGKMILKAPEARFKTWDEVRQALRRVENNEPSVNVDGLLNKRLQRDRQEQEEALARAKAKEEVETFDENIYWKFDNYIIAEVNKIVASFNAKYQGGQLLLQKLDRGSYTLTTPSEQDIEIYIKPLNQNENRRIIYMNSLCQENPIPKEITTPYTIGDKDILAWGYCCASDSNGFNILLLQSPTDSSPQWYTLQGRRHPMYADPAYQYRKEPFAFHLHELPKAAGRINVVWAVSETLAPFDVNLMVPVLEDLI